MKTVEEAPQTIGFGSLGLAKPLVAAVKALGYEEPTPIQREAIPVLLAGKDLLGQAATGTGKTAAFALPLLEVLSRAPGPRRGAARALVLVPTRELAMQVSEAIHKYGRGLNLTVVPVYGGAPMDHQVRALRRGAEVIVATPGRALDHLRRQTLDLGHVQVLVLDEADEMLDMGFAEDIDALIVATPKTRQTALFAATVAPRIAAIAGRHLKNPTRITIAREKRAAGKLPRVRQSAYIVGRGQKMAAFGRILDFESPRSAMVFCRTRLEVDELTDTLNAHGYSAQALHGGMVQKQRDRVMQLFRSEQTEILVATDVAARGLDIDHVSHVINYDVPLSPEAYAHRIGRTGRIGREGIAITLAGPRDQRFLRSVEKLTRQHIEVLNLPTVAELRKRRLSAVREVVREQLAAGGLEEGRAVVESLVQEFDILEIAAAAITLINDGSDKAPVPEPVVEERRPDSKRGRPSGPSARPRRSPGSRQKDQRAVAVLRLNVGKAAGIRPGDLVGAIAGEAKVDSSDIGAIKIVDDYSLVQVPDDLADRIMRALRSTMLRGQRPTVRRQRGRP